jgi:Transposase-associated domain
MDPRRMWMYSEDKKSAEYLKGVREFMDCAIDYKTLRDDKIILCPCSKCQNLMRHKDAEQVELHLYKNGFMKFYSLWIWHTEHIENFVEAVGTSRIVLYSEACTKFFCNESIENVRDESENENVEIMKKIGNQQCTDNDIHLVEIIQPFLAFKLHNLKTTDNFKKFVHSGYNGMFNSCRNKFFKISGM